MTTSISITTVSLLSSAASSSSSSSSSCCCLAVPFSPRITPTFPHLRSRRTISCQVALKSDSPTSSSVEQEEDEAAAAKIGARVRVKVPLKVYHVPKVPEVDLTGMEGEIKQYVSLWKGKRISANLPYKVSFVTEIQGRGPVKFFAHLKEDEFEFL